MKRWIRSKTESNVERIEIDFYGQLDLTELIEASAKHDNRRVFKNTQVVMRDVKAYLENKGLKVLNMKKSTNRNSDSTYYDVDVKLKNSSGLISYLYFRIADHPESILNQEARDNYHNRTTRNYEGLDNSADVSNKWLYTSIEVTGKRFNNYDRAMNRVKEEIDSVLKEVGLDV